ncbi:hypothetical protein ACPA9J_27640 [Pseudomonas aeruginosa]
MSAICCSMFLRATANLVSSSAVNPPASMAAFRALSSSSSRFWSFWSKRSRGGERRVDRVDALLAGRLDRVVRRLFQVLRAIGGNLRLQVSGALIQRIEAGLADTQAKRGPATSPNALWAFSICL